ncbi:hypothetical protein HPB47_018713 [Ixodes persulcatus]|uniref:Uncharacterized protein n=1 Tax=Ixodes persulcatus TaxID=34615 RepID=A0AC60QK05_IXOPE|nr:hypothetical protein HPB47_018713 [Ixodes persulcatus]
MGVTFWRLSVPRSVRRVADTQVVLKCEFMYNKKGVKLMVKWLCKDSLEPVYQWIPRDEVPGNFRMNSRDDYSQYYAICMTRDARELDGQYACIVASLTDQDARHQGMAIYSAVYMASSNPTVSQCAVELNFKVGEERTGSFFYVTVLPRAEELVAATSHHPATPPRNRSRRRQKAKRKASATVASASASAASAVTDTSRRRSGMGDDPMPLRGVIPYAQMFGGPVLLRLWLPTRRRLSQFNQA